MLDVPISVNSIGANGEIRDIDRQWAQLTGLTPDEALLVRPDGFVAWRTGPLPRSPEDRLSQVLRQTLGRAQ
jgi:putative polyketide hydroxylase